MAPEERRRSPQVKAGEAHVAAELASSLVRAEELEVQHFGCVLLQHMVRTPCMSQCLAEQSHKDLTNGTTVIGVSVMSTQYMLSASSRVLAVPIVLPTFSSTSGHCAIQWGGES